MDRLEEQEVRATRIINYKTELPERRLWSTGIIKANIESLQNIWDHFQRRHDKLQRSSELRRYPYFTNKVFEATEREYKMILGFLYDEMSPLNQPLRMPIPPAPTAAQRTHLPRVELPKFSGAFEDWESSRDLFTSLIGQDSTLTRVQKLQFLKTSVQGSTQSTLDKLTIIEANYEIAWQTLFKTVRQPSDSSNSTSFNTRLNTNNKACRFDSITRADGHVEYKEGFFKKLELSSRTLGRDICIFCRPSLGSCNP